MSAKEIPYPRIRNLREDADLSQAEVAKIINCSQVTYSYYEIGRRELPIRVLIRLAEYYNCSVDYLLGLSDKKRYEE